MRWFVGALAAQCVADAAEEVWRDTSLPAPRPEELVAEICRAAHRRIIKVGQERRRHCRQLGPPGPCGAHGHC